MKGISLTIAYILLFLYQVATQDYTEFVNPFIGTHKMGHTFPGATVPFGMVQLSPETNIPPMFVDGQYNREVYAYCSGYQYADSSIFGFSHTHFSGTGHADLGDFRIMPVNGRLILEPGNPQEPGSGYFSYFDHDNELAEPGYYTVDLSTFNIKAELTASERVGFHQYHFQEKDTARIILDLIANIYDYEQKNVWTFIRVENDTLVTGFRQTTGWARTKKVYFAMVFSQPIKDYGHKKYDLTPYTGFWRKFDETHNFPEMAGRQIRAFFNFLPTSENTLKIKFALSAVSVDGALMNLMEEIPHWNFDQTKKEAHDKWNQELSKIEIKSPDTNRLITFYTALYHTILSPVIFEDVDGSYTGIDQRTHISPNFTNYTIFSLWDTYRALHPLFNLIQPQRNSDMIQSMIAHYDQSVHHMLPVWSHYANENWCMIGYHAVPVIADAIIKGNQHIDLQKALKACVNTSNCSYYDGIDWYKQGGFVPEDKNSSSVSKTLEYAYDDWCIAQIAKEAKTLELYSEYIGRSKSYLNVFDETIGFMRPRLSDGSWKKGFDELDTHGHGFIEGNAWNYSLYVPHDPDQLIRLMGGNAVFVQHLDSLFTMELDEVYYAKTEDITRDGIIGNYVHGNEPGHHIPYFYNFAGQPKKTQEKVRMIMSMMYGNSPDGLCGNDDAGQMSAWYIFSALGFYPFCPGSEFYELGSPEIHEATLHFENNKKLKIVAFNQDPKNIYVKKVLLNGKIIDTHQISHHQLINGGLLEFHMTDQGF